MTQPAYPYVYAWGNNARRAELKGRHCRILVNGRVMRTVLVEFEPVGDAKPELVTTSIRALKRWLK